MVTIHSGMATEYAGFISRQVKSVDVYFQNGMSGGQAKRGNGLGSLQVSWDKTRNCETPYKYNDLVSHQRQGSGRLDVVKGMMRQDQYKDVLQNRLIPQLEEWFPNGESYIFMQDGAPCHTAWSVKAFFAEQNILLLDWLGNSPDMNTIENVWELMKREVAKDVITNETQLLERIIHVGNHHPQMQETVQFCIDSMPRRIEALKAAKGGTTKY
ncbi:transposable element Tcb2 transposase [Trichonephila clavipes]|nr:transposable element Tcb2 transposase [Trichonephila clavipes]